METITRNLGEIRYRIADAALRAKRDPQEVTLVAVSKTRTPQEIKKAAELGIKDFGENRVQELQEKVKALRNLGIKWHMVGHLQRNKVKYLTRMEDCYLIHSVDSYRLARMIDKRGRIDNRVMQVLIQVNTADDDNKFGFQPAEVIPFLEKVMNLKHLKVMGLMTMAPYVEDPEEVRFVFVRLRELKERIIERQLAGIEMKHLSMGMTNDFEVAIEEGATLVRIGTGIFGPRR